MSILYYNSSMMKRSVAGADRSDARYGGIALKLFLVTFSLEKK